MDWELDSVKVLGLVQTIPQLAHILHEQRVSAK
jgi:hypothetical protein